MPAQFGILPKCEIDLRKVPWSPDLTKAINLAAYIRAHSFPARVVVGRKTGRVMIRAAMAMGYDTAKIKSAQRRSWKIEIVKPNAQAVREWLGY